ncbi:MAG: alpha-ketoglutarate-dependent dioxygenase AlkB [Methylococcales bacterium]|nr:alpha-ketoglutarate-dependent dioxygenase AlkB [Methylococcales bacterium]
MIQHPELAVIDKFYDSDKSHILYQRLLQEQSWPDNRYTFAGRQFILPRLQTWHADAGIRYSYSNNLLESRPWTPLLLEIRAEIEQYLKYSFNSVLVNWYRNGEDYVGWHADDEPELREQAYIASLSLGAERQFAYRAKKSQASGRLSLNSGALLIMPVSFQQNWLHSVPKDTSVTAGRINLTFRRVAQPDKQPD